MTAPAGAAPGPDRNGLIDMLRLFGAAGIVWFHTHAPGGPALNMVPLFTALSIYLGLQSAAARPAAAAPRARAARLLRPWAAWSAIFLVLLVARGVLSGRGPFAAFEPWMLLTGPALHLWFLPFILGAGLAAGAVMRRFPKGPGGRAFVAGLAAFAVLSALCWPVVAAHPPRPFLQWLHAAPAAGFGLALYTAGNDARRLGALAAALALCCALLAAAGHMPYALQYLIGGVACLAGALIVLPGGKPAAAAAVLAMGVYLVHPLVVAVLERAGAGAPGGVLFGLAAIGVSAAAAHAIAISPLKRLLL